MAHLDIEYNTQTKMNPGQTYSLPTKAVYSTRYRVRHRVQYHMQVKDTERSEDDFYAFILVSVLLLATLK